jgi:hypothetical protein
MRALGEPSSPTVAQTVGRYPAVDEKASNISGVWKMLPMV